jgi:hypothetical protein
MKAAGERQSERFDGPIAVLADIAANVEALEATLVGCKQAGAAAVFVAGGIAHRGQSPLAVWKLLQEHGARLARGTPDMALATITTRDVTPRDEQQRAALARLEKTREELGEVIIARLRRLPDVFRVELGSGAELAVMYGSPRDPMTPLELHLTDDELLVLVGDDTADVIVSGGAGVPFVRPLDGLTVVGAGSVGDAPENRGVERASGGQPNRAAHFVLVSPSDEGLRIEPRWVLY